MKYKKRNLVKILNEVFSTIDDKDYKFVESEKVMINPGVRQGRIERRIRYYQIYDPEEKKIVFGDHDIISEQRQYLYFADKIYKDKLVVYSERELDEQDIKKIISKKVIEYPELIFFYDLLKSKLDDNYHIYGLYELNEFDINEMLELTKKFSREYKTLDFKMKKRTRFK